MDNTVPPTRENDQVRPDVGWANIGQIILNRYEVCRVLGRGAFGQVLEVLDRETGIAYALKRLPPELAGHDGQMKLVLANFSLVSQLTHPHIATLRTAKTDPTNGQIYVLMDLVHGSDLCNWLVDRHTSGADLSIELVLGIAEQIAAGLDFAHSRPIIRGSDGKKKKYGIVHRDLKPANVMIETEQEFRPGVPYVRIVDYGLAAEIQASMQSLSSDHLSNVIGGTPLYMAPEQWEGRTLTRGVDQWALAVMIYEMVAGRKPFNGPTHQAIFANVVAATPERPEAFTDAQWRVLKQTFQYDRKLRHRSCMALVKALAEAEKSTSKTVLSPVIPMPDEFDSVGPKSAPQRKIARRWIAAAVLGIALLVAGVFYWNRIVADPSRPSATRQASKIAEEEARIAEEQRKKADVERASEELRISESQKLQLAEAARKRDEAQRSADSRRAENRQAFSAAIMAAIEAKKHQDWNQVLKLLEAKRALPDNAGNPSNDIADGLIADAKLGLRKNSDFANKVSEAKGHLQNNRLDAVISACAAARQIWPEYPRPGEIDDIEKQANDALAEISLQREAKARKAEADRVATENEKKYQSAIKDVWRLLPLFDKLETSAANVEAALRPALEAKPQDQEANAIAEILKTPKEVRLNLSNGVEMEFVLVPAGEFKMGWDGGKGYSLDEAKPEHVVQISRSFYIAKYPVTVAQFRRFVEASNYQTEAEKETVQEFKGGEVLVDKTFRWSPDVSWKAPRFIQQDHHPVVLVSWNDANEFSSWLSTRLNKSLRLPTEAEWEYVARGTKNNVWPWGNAWNGKKANHADADLKANGPTDIEYSSSHDNWIFTSPVGYYRDAISWCGAYDMVGNVQQWCQDWYSSEYYQHSPNVDPRGPLKGDLRNFRGSQTPTRVERGSSWRDCPG